MSTRDTAPILGWAQVASPPNSWVTDLANLRAISPNSQRSVLQLLRACCRFCSNKCHSVAAVEPEIHDTCAHSRQGTQTTNTAALGPVYPALSSCQNKRRHQALGLSGGARGALCCRRSARPARVACGRAAGSVVRMPNSQLVGRRRP